MDPNDIITALVGTAAVTGGFFGGKKMGNAQASALAVDTVELLQVAVNELRQQAEQKNELIIELTTRVGVLEGLVTQRAEVEEVHAIVERIAEKVGASCEAP